VKAVIQVLVALQDLEERERNLTASQGRAEMAVQTLQRENRYQEEKVKDLEKKVSGTNFLSVPQEILVAHTSRYFSLNIYSHYSIEMHQV
jgi:hypothetical protein